MNDNERMKSFAQAIYCNDHNFPNFAGDGYCPKCGRNCYDNDGYDMEYCANRLITSCPFCHRSWCD